MTMAQSVAVMALGRVLQEAPPMTLYRDPASLGVARFIGSPSINTVAGRTTGARFEGALACDARVASCADAVLAVRPEHLVLGASLEAATAVVTLVEPLGSESLVRVRLTSGEHLVARIAGEAAWHVGDAVGVRVAPGQGLCFRAVDGARLA
jgi:ABC-type sugar transport system ATPase subunit